MLNLPILDPSMRQVSDTHKLNVDGQIQHSILVQLKVPKKCPNTEPATMSVQMYLIRCLLSKGLTGPSASQLKKIVW